MFVSGFPYKEMQVFGGSTWECTPEHRGVFDSRNMAYSKLSRKPTEEEGERVLEGNGEELCKSAVPYCVNALDVQNVEMLGRVCKHFCDDFDVKRTRKWICVLAENIRRAYVIRKRIFWESTPVFEKCDWVRGWKKVLLESAMKAINQVETASGPRLVDSGKNKGHVDTLLGVAEQLLRSRKICTEIISYVASFLQYVVMGCGCATNRWTCAIGLGIDEAREPIPFDDLGVHKRGSEGSGDTRCQWRMAVESKQGHSIVVTVFSAPDEATRPVREEMASWIYTVLTSAYENNGTVNVRSGAFELANKTQ